LFPAQWPREQAERHSAGMVQSAAPLAAADFGARFAAMDATIAETVWTIHKWIGLQTPALRIGVASETFGNRIQPFLWARQLAKENDTAAPEHRETRFPPNEMKKKAEPVKVRPWLRFTAKKSARLKSRRICARALRWDVW
jgi:hypothetical protein